MNGVIRLRFSTNDNIFDKLINWYGRGWAAHVDAQLPDYSLIGAVPFKGVHHLLFDSVSTKKLTVELPTTKEIQDKFYAFITDQLGKSYDWRSLFSMITYGRDWREDDSWFCSELIAAALEHSGYFEHPLSISSARFMPQDLLMICSTKVRLPEVTVSRRSQVT